MSNVKKACETFWARDRAKYTRLASGKKNEKPEQELVVGPHVEYFSKNDWSMHVYESKAVKQAWGGWDQTSVVLGHPDMAGVCPVGFGAYVEAKAPGKRNTLRPGQREFLIEKIKRGAFGIVSDSLEYTIKTYNKWVGLSPLERVEFLMSELPPLREKVNVTNCPF